ncbi:MAG: acyltransferase [Gammaproteobacteria bacterium]|nr:acyltransferase [Gammaproteobacteria bacterium]
MRLSPGKERYPALTGIRAFGATAVFFAHFPVQPDWHVVINVMAFFYALSGFLIVRLYHEQAEITTAWLSKYFLNRFARIYPVYFLLLCLAVPLQWPARPAELLTNYTLTHALFYHERIILAPSWSLTVEECFYALAPVFMILARRRGFAAVFALGAGLLGAALAISELRIGFLQTPVFVLSTTFFGHFAEFFAGVWLALYVTRLERAGSLRVAGCRQTIAGLAAVSVLAGAMLVIYRHAPLDVRAVILINNFLIPAPIALLYCGLIREDTVLSRALSGNCARLLGRGSYSFYLLHTLVIDYLSAPLLRAFPGHRPLLVLGTFAVAWTIAIVLFLYYEEPMNLAIRRWAALRAGNQARGSLRGSMPAGR